ncbi:MAG: MFS transporter [Acidobacteria bacterium]|nr:MFS transporter [Acidobacteriota bacterium]
MLKPRLNLLLTLLVYLGFVSIGLPDGLTGVAWPSMRGYFGLPLDALGGLLVMYTAGYLISSFSSGRLLARISVGALLALSCLATGVSLLGYASAGHWWMVTMLGSLAGLGAGAIDAGLNTYAATHFSARMVNWLHAFYGIGALSGPLLMTGVLRSGHLWQLGYAIVGCGQLALAACFGLSQRQWNGDRRLDDAPTAEPVIAASSISTMRLPVVRFSVAIFFVYTGIEAAAGAWAYSMFTEARAISMMTAGTWVSLYWGALTVGRILSGMIAGRISVRSLLRCCIAGQAAGALLIWLDLSTLSGFLGLAMIGLASAPVFPSLIASTPDRIHQNHLANAVGFQIAAAVLGQSLLPALVGVLAQRLGLEVVAPALLAAALLLYSLHEAMTTSQAKTVRETQVAT